MISIVMAYHNRINQLEKTLQSINQSSVKDIEIIVVDDFSDDANNPSSLLQFYKHLNPKLISMRDIDGEKKYMNPCIPYNVGLRASSGDIVIIQNPECAHIGDVLKFSQDNCNETSYFSFNCYSLNKNDTDVFQKTNTLPTFKESFTGYGESGWYNHHIYNPRGYHFCSALSRKNLIRLNGFDERYAYGHCFDDDEFAYRIKLLGLRFDFVFQPMVIHQFHESVPQQRNTYLRRNDILILEMTLLENKVMASCNREFIK